MLQRAPNAAPSGFFPGEFRVLKILVCVKRAVDYNVRVRARADGLGLDIANARMSMNPFDEIAVEEAVRLKEAGVAGEVIAVSAGSAACQETLRTALALGADRALLIESDAELQPLAVSRLMTAVCEREAPDLVLCGKQAIDDEAGQVGAMLAARLGWAQATSASQVAVDAAARLMRVTREIDGGREVVVCLLPCVLTCDLRLNEPRYATLPNLMKARKKTIDVLTPEALGVGVVPALTMLAYAEPPRRAAGERLASVGELVDKLKNVARVI